MSKKHGPRRRGVVHARRRRAPTGGEPAAPGADGVLPAERTACRNPACTASIFEEHRLRASRRVWSFATNHYAPPAPYVAPDPFVPYTVAAVELPDEKMVVLGQVAGPAGAATGGGDDGHGDLHVGQEVELVLDTLYEDDDHEYVIWKWRPVADAPGSTGGA